jgi:hypothetical protein
VQSAHAARHGKSKLGAGSQPGMWRNSLQNAHRVDTIQLERSLHRKYEGSNTFAFRTRNVGMLGGSDAQDGFEIIERYSNAAELAAEAAVKIEKAEM